MESYATQLKQQVDELEKLIKCVDQRLRLCTVPERQKVCVTNHKNGFQYYDVDETGKRTYLKKENMAMITAVVQRDYDRVVLKTLIEARSRIERFLRRYDMDAFENVYDKLCAARKVLVNPIIEPEVQFIQSWKEQFVGDQNSYPKAVTYQTEQGEVVRSKSEKILADLFLKYGIPYVYEPCLQLQNGKNYYPDFVLLNVRKRKTIYWEHFGLITDGEYAAKALKKLNAYEMEGLYVGESVLYSMESDTSPLNVKRIEKKLNKYLL